MNHGTRRQWAPWGGAYDRPLLPREKIANQQVRDMLFLIGIIESVGGFWSIENPVGSYLWHVPELKELTSRNTSVALHQCMFGLRPPDHYLQKSKHKTDMRTRKATKIVTNLPALAALSRRCDGKHSHVAAWGSVRYRGVSTSRARAAGAYPRSLCAAWAQLVNDHVY